MFSTLYNGSGAFFSTSGLVGSAYIYGSIYSMQIVENDSGRIFWSDNAGKVMGSGDFWLSDNFASGLRPGRRFVRVFALNLSDVGACDNPDIEGTVYVLSSNDDVRTWYKRAWEISGLNASAEYYIGVGRSDSWEIDYHIEAAWYNLNIVSPAVSSIEDRLTGLDMAINIYDNQSHFYLGEVDDVIYGFEGEGEVFMPNIGQTFGDVDYGSLQTVTRLKYYPQVGNLSWLNGHILNYSQLPSHKTIRIWNRSEENQEVLNAIPVRSQIIFDRGEPLAVMEDYFATNITTNDNFSRESLLTEESDAIFPQDVQLVTVAGNDLTALWNRFAVSVNYIVLPSMTGIGPTTGEPNYVGVIYSGFVEYSNQSNLMSIFASSGNVEVNISGLTDIKISDAFIQDVEIKVRNVEVQQRRVAWAGIQLEV